MNLIKKAENPKNKNRDQDYLLIANCYYNMSYYGNSWMMKRIGWTASSVGYRDNYTDDLEYYCCHKAKYYYQKAQKSSKSQAFVPLCEYMMTKCTAREKEYNLYKQYDRYYYVSYNELNVVNEKVFADFEAKYGKTEYGELLYNCEIFSHYFKSRR